MGCKCEGERYYKEQNNWKGESKGIAKWTCPKCKKEHTVTLASKGFSVTKR